MPDFLELKDDGLFMRPVGPWTAKKLDYLARYIDIFEKAMRGKWSIRNYIDLLSGPGKNRIRGTGEILLGSPLVALTTLHPFTGYFFVEWLGQAKDALEQRCNDSHFHQRVNIYQGDCNVLVDKVIDSLRVSEMQSLNLAFLDPEGLELQWQTVVKLATIKRMDIILYYPEMGLNLNMQKLYKSGDETAIDLFFGGPEWRDVYERYHGKIGLHRHLVDFYKSNLGTLGYSEVFRGDECVDEEPLIRSQSRNAPLYRLIFASKHNLGIKFWRQVVRRDITGQITMPLKFTS